MFTRFQKVLLLLMFGSTASVCFCMVTLLSTRSCWQEAAFMNKISWVFRDVIILHIFVCVIIYYADTICCDLIHMPCSVCYSAYYIISLWIIPCLWKRHRFDSGPMLVRRFGCTRILLRGNNVLCFKQLNPLVYLTRIMIGCWTGRRSPSLTNDKSHYDLYIRQCNEI